MSQPGLDLRILIKNTEKKEDSDDEDEEEGFIFKEESKVGEEYKKIMEEGKSERSINVEMENEIDIGEL